MSTNIVAWVVTGVMALIVGIAVYDALSPPWSLRACLYRFELVTGIPFGWVIAVLVPSAIALGVMWWLA